MAESQGLKTKIKGVTDQVKYYWTEPPKGKYMPFKEIAAYAVGGIGSYFIIAMGAALVVSTTNMIVGGAIGVDAMDMYILYVIATLANIPLTGIRANMIDNTRGKGGKYRPYLLSMGIPTALIAMGYVWFPYEQLKIIFTGEAFGKASYYVVKCAVVLIFNLLLQFFFNFFNDAYTNLIHVLSPNTQERTDVLAIKSVVYSMAPSIMNIALPIIAKNFFDDDLYDIGVYRVAYPVFAIIGIILTIVVFANTQEKIVQAKTHTIQISFKDSFKAVAKNKYFWIISLAGWVGFLEGAYGNILQWSYQYGHECNGNTYALITTLTGNACLWGMILAPICIRKWGKKKVLIGVNFLNIICIAAMLIDMRNIWWLFVCVYFNWLVGAFEQITTPAIQADIRDYQQYRTGERIDGMFATVATIGSIVTLFTSSVLPMVQKKYGVVQGNGFEKPYDILDTATNPDSPLYQLMTALIILAAVGAFLNMVPYFFYDFDERKQKSVIRVLQVRSLFEDYGNKALRNRQIVEAIDMVNNARDMSVKSHIEVKSAKEYIEQGLAQLDEEELAKIDENPKAQSGDRDKAIAKAVRKKARKMHKDALNFNEEIEISKFVCQELDKFSSEVVSHQVDVYTEIYNQGLAGLTDSSSVLENLKKELADAKAMPKGTEDEKELRKFHIEAAKKKITARKEYEKNFGSVKEFKEPSMEDLTALYDREEEFETKLNELYIAKSDAHKAKNVKEENDAVAEIKNIKAQLKPLRKDIKSLLDTFASFNRAAKPYNDAKKLLIQQENYKHFDEIAALYDEAKEKADEEDRIKHEEHQKKIAEEEAELMRRKAEKAEKKNKKK